MFAAVFFLVLAFVPPVPGAVDRHVTQSNSGRTICVAGYTARVRPPTSYTTPLKRRLAAKQHVNPADFELDHLVPLELGGAPRDRRNLWLEPWPDARRKDVAENRLHRDVCAHGVSLRLAQRAMRRWSG